MLIMSLQQQIQQYTVLLLYLRGAAMQDWKQFWGKKSGGRMLEAGITTM
jgi:hypothetical protein